VSGAAVRERGTIVVKLGGDTLSVRERLVCVLDDLGVLQRRGARLVVVHGGGPQATELSKRLGIERRIVGGRRITDAATLEVMKMVLAGQVSVDLTLAMRSRGLLAVGLSGVSLGIIGAVKRPPRVVSGCGDEPVDFGHVGDIVSVNTAPLMRLLDAGYIPVLNSLGGDDQGRAYNINADIAATRVARALSAAHLVLVTGKVAGVMRDPHDPASRIPRLTPDEARQAIADGTIRGGMIPKIEESLEVLDQVGAIHIAGSLGAGELLQALDAPGSVGTALVSGP
jgi:acetylglutamate kinase